MNFTTRQMGLLSVALTLFYDEVAKTSTEELKDEIRELSKMIQEKNETQP